MQRPHPAPITAIPCCAIADPFLCWTLARHTGCGDAQCRAGGLVGITARADFLPARYGPRSRPRGRAAVIEPRSDQRQSGSARCKKPVQAARHRCACPDQRAGPRKNEVVMTSKVRPDGRARTMARLTFSVSMKPKRTVNRAKRFH